MPIHELTELVIKLCIKIHKKIGPGCFEKVYEEILYYELTKLGIYVIRQQLMSIGYEELEIKNAYKLDLLIGHKLITEIKSVWPLPAVYFNQLQTHLTLTGLKHGMILNFKVPLMKEGIHRVYNNKGREEII